MKKLLLLFITVAAVNLYTSAQSIALYDLNNTDVSGTELYVNELHGNEFIVDLLIMNNSANAVDVIFKKSIISLQTGVTEYFCVGATCFPPSSPESTAMNVAANTLHTDTCFAHMIPGASPDPSLVMYTIYNAANPDDSASVVVHFNELNEINTNDDVVLEMYPNPASDIVNIDYKLNKANTLFTIHNILGTEVKRINLNDLTGSAFVNVSDLRSGVYFYSMRNNNDVLKTGRLIIK